MLTLVIAAGLIYLAVRNASRGKVEMASFYGVAMILLIAVVAFLQYQIVWPEADAAETAMKEHFVATEMESEIGRRPDEVKLQKSKTVKRGDDDVYVGTARCGGDVWDVVVYFENNKIHMEAIPRNPFRRLP